MNNLSLLNMVNSWSDPSAPLHPHGESNVAANERTLAKLRARAEAMRSAHKPTKVKVIHNISDNTIQSIEVLDE